MKSILFVMLSLLFFSCTKERKTVSYYLINNSGVDIKFVSGSKVLNQLPHLKNGTNATPEIHYDKSSFAEIGGIKGVRIDLAPVKVVFNNSDTVIHYNDSLPHAGKYLNMTSNRCLYNKSSYTVSSTSSSQVATYTFSEADYEFAKQ